MNKSFLPAIIIIIFIFLLTACSSPTPPTELAPGGEIIQKAIALQLSQTEQLLSQQLNAVPPELKINQINVKKIEPIFIADLASYHLQGNYNVTLKLPHQKVRQKNNTFDIYLQRQAEGKTWRLLKKVLDYNTKNTNWRSYLIN
jgi:PBP1b-binding outer membrane lipoprotein LpoB